MTVQEKKKILIADDHELLRGGLRQVLEMQNEYEIFEASNGIQALNVIKQEKLAAAILDIEMPEMTGYDVAKKVLKKKKNTNIIFLTMFKDDAMINNALDIGVKGYVLKENTVSEIVQCLETVLEGKHYMSPALTKNLIRRKTRSNETEALEEDMEQFTDTEESIIKYVGMMKTNQEMAEDLNVSVRTIQNHRNNICMKLGISGTHALLKYAIENAEKF